MSGQYGWAIIIGILFVAVPFYSKQLLYNKRKKEIESNYNKIIFRDTEIYIDDMKHEYSEIYRFIEIDNMTGISVNGKIYIAMDVDKIEAVDIANLIKRNGSTHNG